MNTNTKHVALLGFGAALLSGTNALTLSPHGRITLAPPPNLGNRPKALKLAGRILSAKKGETVRDANGTSYIRWTDGSLRKTRKLVAATMRQLTPEASASAVLHMAQAAGAILNKQDEEAALSC